MLQRSTNTLVTALTAALVALSLVSLVACGKSIEGESKKWDANTMQLEKYAAQYPAFKAAINAHVAQARKAYDAAKAVTEEDAKVKAMSVANGKLTQLITPFKNITTSVTQVASLKKDPLLMKMPAGELNPAIELADAAVVKAKALLANATGIDTSGAVVSRLEEAQRTITSGTTRLVQLKQQQLAKADKKAAKRARKAAKKDAKKRAAAAEAAKDEPAGAAAKPSSPTPTPAPTGK